MLTVHHLQNSRSQRILWLLEELGADYEVKRYERHPETNLAPTSLNEVHPLGKSPVITDGDKTIAETGAIVEYLLDTYGEGRFRPAAGSAAFERYRYWMHAAEGSYMTIMILRLFISRMEEAPMPFFVKPVAKKLTGAVRAAYLDHTQKALFDYFESELGRGDWLAGDSLTGADIMMSFPAEAFAARGDINAAPHIKAYVQRLQARDGYKRALERGGPYDFA